MCVDLGSARADDVSAGIRELGVSLAALVQSDLPGMGLDAGDRPAADVEALLGIVAAAEYELGRRMSAASAAGSLPIVGLGAMPRARGWSTQWARRLARAAELAAQHPEVACAWARGTITSEHVAALARGGEALTDAEMQAVVGELTPLWGQLCPAAVLRFVQAVVRLLHPPCEPTPDEVAAHDERCLSFAVLGDSVVLTGTLPRIEGEMVMAAVEAFAERLRVEADAIPSAARRADGLVALVTTAAAAGSIPTRGGVPVALTVTLDRTRAGDAVWSTGRGHLLTSAEQRFVSCDCTMTAVEVASGRDGGGSSRRCAHAGRADTGQGPAGRSVSDRVGALAEAMLGDRVVLSLGRSQRTASESQRRALAVRDRGCVIPGCDVPPEACQVHHVREWSAGGTTDVDAMVMLCWCHHRQVDLGMWSIEPLAPVPASVPIPAFVDDGSCAATRANRDGEWPANRGAPWRIIRRPRARWRM